MDKILDLELFRDGGSFVFNYKDKEYQCMTPLFIIETRNDQKTADLDVYKDILLAFARSFEEDIDQESLMRTRINDATKSFLIIEKYEKDKLQK